MLDYDTTWAAARKSAARLLEQFGHDANNLAELHIVALSFMDGTAYAVLHKEEKEQAKGKDKQAG